MRFATVPYCEAAWSEPAVVFVVSGLTIEKTYISECSLIYLLLGRYCCLSRFSRYCTVAGGMKYFVRHK